MVFSNRIQLRAVTSGLEFRAFHKKFAHLKLNVPSIHVIAKMSVTASPEAIIHLFKGELDRFKGISISSEQEPRSYNEFSSSLQNSLSIWKEKKICAVWMRVYLEHSHWIPILVENGFTFHHTKPSFVTMVKWLPEDEPNNLPSYAHNTVGVGAFVVNEADELLVVRERFSMKSHWKFPGGYVDLGEDLSAAAVREVAEETGIETEFEFLLAFRHMHNLEFGCSNIYFIIHLKPTSREITMCKNELEDCRWMKIHEFLTHPDVHEMNKFFCRRYLEGREAGVHIQAASNKFRLKDFSRDQTLYYIETLDRNKGNADTKSGDLLTSESNLSKF